MKHDKSPLLSLIAAISHKSSFDESSSTFHSKPVRTHTPGQNLGFCSCNDTKKDS